MFFLVGEAVLVCVLFVGAFIVAEIYHVDPLWIILSGISVGFFAGAREDYRKEFRSPRFVAFVCGWVVINAIVFIVFLGFFGDILLREQGLKSRPAHNDRILWLTILALAVGSISH